MSQSLSYPNITFTESIIGPQPTTRPWRDEIGVAGEFSRGPVVPVRVTDRQQFAQLFGEDSSAGSLFVQQAMEQGSTNFTIARAVPDASPGKSVLKFSSGNVNISPLIGYKTVGASLIPSPYHYTTGLELQLDYIGSPIVNRTIYGSVFTQEGKITHPSFEGRAKFRFLVVNYQQGKVTEDSVTTDTVSVNVNSSPIGGYQVVSVSKTDANWADVSPFIIPGFALQEVSPAYMDSSLLITTRPFSLSSTEYGFLVKGQFGKSYVGQVSTTSSGNSTSLSIDNIFNTGTAVPSPTLSILQDMNVYIAGEEYVQTAIPTGSGPFVLTIGAGAPAASVGTKVALRPRIKSVNLGANSIVVEGLFSPTTDITISSQISLYGIDDTFTIVSATPNNPAGENTIVLEETIDPLVFTVGRSVLPNPASNAQTLSLRVGFSPKGNYLLGYHYEPTSGASLYDADSSFNYYALTDEVYNDGYNDYTVDNYIALAEDAGGVYKEFKYITAPSSVTTATQLHLAGLGINVRYGEDDVEAIALLEKGQYYIPFAKGVVTIGDAFDGESPFVPGESVLSVLSDLETAIYGDAVLTSLISKVETQNILPPYSVTLTTAFSGVEANRVKWVLRRFIFQYETTSDVASATDTTVTVAGFPNGVVDGDASDYLIKFSGHDTVYTIDSWDTNTGVITLDDALTANVLADEVVYIYSPSLTTDLLFNEEPTLTSAFDIAGGTSAYGADYTFENGFSGPNYAQKDFYSLSSVPVLRVIALSPGSFGNRLLVTITPGAVNGGYANFQIDVTDTNQNIITGASKIETFFLNTAEIDSQTGLFLKTQNSTLIRAFFLPLVENANTTGSVDSTTYALQPLRVAPALELESSLFSGGDTALSAQGGIVIRDVALETGSDFSPSSANKQLARLMGFLSAVNRLEGQDIAVLAIPGLPYGDPYYKPVFDAAINQVLNSRPETGVRMAVFEAPPGSSDRQVSLLAAQLDSDRIVLLRGHQTTRANTGISYSNIGSTGTYSGYVWARPPHISPAAAYGGGLPSGVLGVDVPATPSFLDGATRGHCEILAYDAGLRNFRFWNGVTTSSDPNKKYVSTRRILDQVISDLYKYLQWVRSEPNTRDLQMKAASAVDAYLAAKLRDEWLIRVAPTICGPENNTPSDMIAGNLNIRIRLTPVFPADFIGVHVIQDLTQDFSLQTAPSTN